MQSARSRWGTGNKRGFSYVELGSRRGILENIFGNIFTDYMYIVVTIIFQLATLRAVDTTGTPQRPWTRAQNEPKIILARNIDDMCSGWAPKISR